MIRGSPERDGEVRVLEAHEHVVEPGTVLEGEQARQCVLPRVEVVQGRLHDSRGLVSAGEDDDRLLQLVGLGGILCIEDHEELPAGQLKTDVAGARLGLRNTGGDRNDDEVLRDG